LGALSGVRALSGVIALPGPVGPSGSGGLSGLIALTTSGDLIALTSCESLCRSIALTTSDILPDPGRLPGRPRVIGGLGWRDLPKCLAVTDFGRRIKGIVKIDSLFVLQKSGRG